MDQVKTIADAWRTVRPETTERHQAEESVPKWSPQGQVGFDSWFSSDAEPKNRNTLPNWSVDGNQAPWSKMSG